MIWPVVGKLAITWQTEPLYG